MGNVNRKASRDEMAHAAQAIREAFPDLEPVFGGHGDYGGHRAPRDHTISFRLRDAGGNYRSNVVGSCLSISAHSPRAKFGRWCHVPMAIDANGEAQRDA